MKDPNASTKDDDEEALEDFFLESGFEYVDIASTMDKDELGSSHGAWCGHQVPRAFSN